MKALDAVRKIYPDSSRRTLQNWIKAGRFLVDGLPLMKENQELTEGQIILAASNCKPQLIPGLKVIYEDRYMIAIDKEVGLLSVPLDGGEVKRSALGVLREHFDTDQIFAVHRIDRETSGCLLFARGKESEQRLKLLFEKHDLKREYFAIVDGRMKESEGTWQSKLLELETLDVVESDAEGSRDAITHYSVIHRSPKYSYVKLTLETGRKHQIRVHCSTAGHPVLGDDRYGSNEDPIRRLCLHAWKLELVHPFTKKILAINAHIPPAFKKLGGNRF
jgi:tRNA pseudouridine32 synthase/23S rRNA pseudouridine746 synthase/23S rRNA pseudouridine1911/1915/1917 synthase